MNQKPQFQSIAGSQVAINSNPKGILQFIGGTLFGSYFPTFWYQHFLNKLFEEGYTLIILGFDFTPNHYQQAFSMLNQQILVIPELIRQAKSNEENDFYLEPSNYYWCGHSIGGKYLSLLEGFSFLNRLSNEHKQNVIYKILRSSQPSSDYSDEKINRKVQAILEDINRISKDINRKVSYSESQINKYLFQQNSNYVNQNPLLNFYNLSNDNFRIPAILNQRSLLIAPDNSTFSSAIPFPDDLASKILAFFGLSFQPSAAQTKALMKTGDLFNLMGLISFRSDNIAEKTCEWFIRVLEKPCSSPSICLENNNLEELIQCLNTNSECRQILQLQGTHLKPLGIPIGDKILNLGDKLSNLFDNSVPWFQLINERNEQFEEHVIEQLENLPLAQSVRS